MRNGPVAFLTPGRRRSLSCSSESQGGAGHVLTLPHSSWVVTGLSNPHLLLLTRSSADSWIRGCLRLTHIGGCESCPTDASQFVSPPPVLMVSGLTEPFTAAVTGQDGSPLPPPPPPLLPGRGTVVLLPGVGPLWRLTGSFYWPGLAWRWGREETDLLSLSRAADVFFFSPPALSQSRTSPVSLTNNLQF